MADVRSILEEALAEDLPIGEHMLQWTPDEIRRYAEEGGFWSPPERLTANPGQDDAALMLSRAATRLAIDESPAGPSFSWETYEHHVIPLDSPGGEALAAIGSSPIVAADQKAVPLPSKWTEGDESGTSTVRACPSWCGSKAPPSV